MSKPLSLFNCAPLFRINKASLTRLLSVLRSRSITSGFSQSNLWSFKIACSAAADRSARPCQACAECSAILTQTVRPVSPIYTPGQSLQLMAYTAPVSSLGSTGSFSWRCRDHVHWHGRPTTRIPNGRNIRWMAWVVWSKNGITTVADDSSVSVRWWAFLSSILCFILSCSLFIKSAGWSLCSNVSVTSWISAFLSSSSDTIVYALENKALTTLCFALSLIVYLYSYSTVSTVREYSEVLVRAAARFFTKKVNKSDYVYGFARSPLHRGPDTTHYFVESLLILCQICNF